MTKKDCILNDEPKPIRPMDREGLYSWLRRNLDDSKTTGLNWVDKSNGVFKIVWKHASQRTYKESVDGNVFMKWAIHTGIYRRGDGGVSKNLQRWKANFRCALHSQKKKIILQVKDSISRGEEACRVYRMIDDQSTLKDKVEEIRNNKKRKKINDHDEEPDDKNNSQRKKVRKKRGEKEKKKVELKEECLSPQNHEVEFVDDSRIPNFSKIGTPSILGCCDLKNSAPPDIYTQTEAYFDLKRRISESQDEKDSSGSGTSLKKLPILPPVSSEVSSSVSSVDMELEEVNNNTPDITDVWNLLSNTDLCNETRNSDFSNEGNLREQVLKLNATVESGSTTDESEILEEFHANEEDMGRKEVIIVFQNEQNELEYTQLTAVEMM